MNIDISGSMHDTELKFVVCALMILLEGSMSQTFYLGLLILCQKTGNFLHFFAI